MKDLVFLLSKKICKSSQLDPKAKKLFCWIKGILGWSQPVHCSSWKIQFENEIQNSSRQRKSFQGRVAHGNYRGIAANGENRQIFYVKFKDFWCKSGGQKTNLRGEVWPPKSDGRYFWNLTWNHFMRQALKCSDKFVTICESLVKTAYLRSIKQKSTPNFDWNFWLFDALYKTIALWL